jgi:hypothetical protein
MLAVTTLFCTTVGGAVVHDNAADAPTITGVTIATTTEKAILKNRH